MASTLLLLSSILSRLLHHQSDNNAIIQEIGDQLIRNGEYEKCYRLFFGIQRQTIDLQRYDHYQYRLNKQHCILYQIKCLLHLGNRRQALDICIAISQQSPSAMWYLLAADIYIEEHQLELALLMVRKSYSCLSEADPLWSQACLKERILHEGVLQQCGGKNNNSPSTDLVLALPFDIVCSILASLPLTGIVRCARVNHMWNRLIKSTPLLWQRLNFNGNTQPLPMTTLALYLSRLHGAPLLSIRIPNTQNTEGILKTLCKANCRQLYELDFTFMQCSSKQCWDLFCQMMRLTGGTLRVLRLGCGGFRLANIIELVSTTCHRLEILDLRNCFSLKEDQRPYDAPTHLERFGARLPFALLEHAAGLPTLSICRLVLSDLSGLTGPHLALILLRCPQLMDLTLMNCSINIIPVINLLYYSNRRLERLHYYRNYASQLTTTDHPPTAVISATDRQNNERLDINQNEFNSAQPITNSALYNGISTKGIFSWKRITLKQTRILTDDILHHLLVDSYHTIEKLDLEGNPHLTDASLLTMIQPKTCLRQADGMHRLNELSLASCVGISKVGLCAFFQHTPHLEQLDLSGLFNVTDSVLQTIALYCPRLLKLDLALCSSLTDSGIRCFIDTLKRHNKDRTLQYLSLIGTTLSIDSLAYAMCHVQQDGI